jgi:cytochrome c553
MRTVSFLIVSSALLCISAAAIARQDTLKPVATVKQLMTALVVPSSDVVFNATSDPPKTDQQWAAVWNNALALAESGNLLMIGPRARDGATWMKMARAQVDAAQAALKAAEAKNLEDLATAGDQIYETCAACHERYMDK